MEKRYIIGIDLGTTNCAAAFVELKEKEEDGHDIRLFKIPQVTGPGEVTSRFVLPSFCYIPGKYDLPAGAGELPWKDTHEIITGAWARDHGSKVPARQVSSAKSWLCHDNADRRAKILPWGVDDGVDKISPVTATAAYLRHIRQAWNYSMARDDDDAVFERQHIIITVPASFDEVARDLTMEAAKMAGLSNIILLEEPLAAFYSWISRHEDNWREFVRPGELVLVCDVGGGTTDFTLIALVEADGSPRFERIAVGDHLILGGDNIDLALARLCVAKFAGTASLDRDKWQTLCHLCRNAKERILSGKAETETITLVGGGTRLVGGTLTATLKRREIDEIVINGFFPLLARESGADPTTRKGISEFGLPYESEPAIPRHIGRFLDRHLSDIQNFRTEKDAFPDCILFNGGSLSPQSIRSRVCESIRHWFQKPGDAGPRVLETRSLDLAVAYGAAYYGLVREGIGVRVGSGSPRSYYLGVALEGESERDVDRAVCLVERGLDEGSRIRLDEHGFTVIANQPVSFDLFSSSFRAGDRSGDLVAVDDSMSGLPPLNTVIRFGKKGEKKKLPVTVEAEYTEAGVLELWCRSVTTDHRWKLRFQLRDIPGTDHVKDFEVLDDSLIEDALSLLDLTFARNTEPAELSGLVKSIARAVKRPREKWPLAMIRKISDCLLDLMEARKVSPDHEIRWMNLFGFCMRPGFGDGLDPQRISRVWKIYKTGVIFRKNRQAANEWWILWRRLAGGLSAGRQRQIVQDAGARLVPAKGGRAGGQERIEIWMALANMELISVKEKMRWADILVSEIQKPKAKSQLFWTLCRICARELLYGPVDRVIPPARAEKWIRLLADGNWKDFAPVGTALARMSRKTGDMGRDISPDIADAVVKRLEHHGMEDHAHMVKSITPIKKTEVGAIFGESFPAGIILRGE
ncbi:MAG: Hsp70 family protein [Deltaproteobacteria bacterium]|nr:Hsp70 family protein [Deltaproteobacteria bacterium]